MSDEREFGHNQKVLVELWINDADSDSDYKNWQYEVGLENGTDTIWVPAAFIRPYTPAASLTRPDGEPPFNRYAKTHYRATHVYWTSMVGVNDLTDWGIDWQFLAVDTAEDVILLKVTAVSQMYLDAVAEKQAANTTKSRWDVGDIIRMDANSPAVRIVSIDYESLKYKGTTPRVGDSAPLTVVLDFDVANTWELVATPSGKPFGSPHQD